MDATCGVDHMQRAAELILEGYEELGRLADEAIDRGDLGTAEEAWLARARASDLLVEWIGYDGT